MKYATRRKAKYFSSILVVTLAIIGVALYGLFAYQKAIDKYNQDISELHKTEVLVGEIQYSFKLQVQEWKNILLRGKDPVLFEKYFESFSEQFLITQNLGVDLIKYLETKPLIVDRVNRFLVIHRSILADYLDALNTFKKNAFNPQSGDQRVVGIDRDPDRLLISLSATIDTEIAKEKRALSLELSLLENNLITGFIIIQGFLCILLVRLTGNLLFANLTDKVTKAGNRTSFVESIKDLINSKKKAMIVIFDIDQFKIINESCSNEGGDRYLRKIARLIDTFTSPGDILCRIGGDQFGLITHKDLQYSKDLIADINSFIALYDFTHDDITISLSCSSASYYFDGDNTQDVEEVLNSLYVGMQVAKTKRDRQTVHYSSDDKNIAWIQKQMRIVHQISSILDNHEVVLFRQAISPVTSLVLNKHYEILLRLKNKEGKYESPGLFLQAAERFQLITKIDRYMLNHVVEYLLEHPEDRHYYSINLSGQTLSDESFIKFVKELFNSPLIPTERLSFEITETEMIKNFNSAIKIISCLTSYRCKIYLDDFGTGMSSYSYITKLGLDAIKIDGTFIKQINVNRQNKAIVRSIVSLAKDLNIKTVAEFVETQEQFDTIKELGIDYAQGYLLHKPELLYKPHRALRNKAFF